MGKVSAKEGRRREKEKLDVAERRRTTMTKSFVMFASRAHPGALSFALSCRHGALETMPDASTSRKRVSGGRNKGKPTPEKGKDVSFFFLLAEGGGTHPETVFALFISPSSPLPRSRVGAPSPGAAREVSREQRRPFSRARTHPNRKKENYSPRMAAE